MIVTCLRLGFPPSGAAPHQRSCRRRWDCWNNGGTELLLEPDFLRGAVHLTFLGRSATGTESRCPFSGARMMAGKGRTYPGGVTKWQWKRRQFKEDRKLQLKRLSRDRELYMCRRREELKSAEPWISSLDTLVDGSSATNKVVPITPIRKPDSTTCVEDLEVGVSTEAANKGMQNYKVFQKGWSPSKGELQQIQKVKSLLKSKVIQPSHSPPKQELTAASFERLQLSAPSLEALQKVMALPSMSRVQEATLPTILTGEDLLIRTLGSTDDLVTSLLHGIEVAVKTPRHMTVSGRHSVHVLLVCPTREQVEVAEAEARKLLMFHTGIRLQAVMGGRNIKEELSRLRRSPCEILVATPGRLLANMRESAELRGQLRGLKVMVLHDVHMLLSMGYEKTIENIMPLLPRNRQTIMWSKTLSDEVNTLSHHTLKKDYVLINTIKGEADKAHAVGKQEFVLVPMKMHLGLIFKELKAHFEHEPKGKVVVFCQTIRTTTFMAELFKNLGFCTREVHIRKKDDVRSGAAAEFRTSQEGMILFTCGASVWGVANPDVTLIIQVGSPIAREQYARRVTPTGQTTKKRDCMLILMPHERTFLKQLVDLSVSESVHLEVDPDLELQVQRALEGVDYQIRAKAYIAWLRYHVTKESTDSGKEKTVRLADMYASALGFKNRPMISRKTVARVGLQKFLLSARIEKELNREMVMDRKATVYALQPTSS